MSRPARRSSSTSRSSTIVSGGTRLWATSVQWILSLRPYRRSWHLDPTVHVTGASPRPWGAREFFPQGAEVGAQAQRLGLGRAVVDEARPKGRATVQFRSG